jgi:signal transduction histidine kinase
VGAEIAWRAIHDIGPLPHRFAVAVGSTQKVFPALLMAVGVTIGLLIRQRREHADTMRAQAAAQAIIGERLRIARELHDSVAHRIGIIALQAGAANRVFDTQPARARQAIGVVESASRETLAELRRMLGGLRASDPGEVLATGLADLPKLASATAEAGVRVDVRWLGTPAALPAEIDRSAFRIIQEAVTNVVRHAGVDSCRVTVEHADGALAVEVLDEGQGRPGNPGAGYGLVGMRERVALLHGDFSAGPRVEGGFRVAARLPMPVTAA